MEQRKINKILFISYQFEPSLLVGAKRVSYWANNICKVDETFECDVITATPQNTAMKVNKGSIRSIYYVENKSKSLLTSFIKDEGVTWKQDLTFFFKQNPELAYDFVLLSGGPFMHFSIAPFLKQKFNARIILDFRDPFSNNPRFGKQFLKKIVKRRLETKFIEHADIIISVNKYCLDLLSKKFEHSNKYFIIDNGYNESVLEKVSKIDLDRSKINLVYAGKIYRQSHLSNLLKLITSTQYKDRYVFHYVGSNDLFFDRYRNSNNIILHGLKSYLETLNIISSSDVGIIFTSGDEFESTTKVFDYIGLEKTILIISEGRLKTGNLQEITKDYPSIFWCNNKTDDIEGILRNLNKKDLIFRYPNKDNLSRRQGLTKLISILKKNRYEIT